ncbi:hypothetical protein M9435_005164 [Picochlorum sp. BPE23]|nr:hypothetical protein M9435_005164 [Picochlorum sp. BPE23]
MEEHDESISVLELLDDSSFLHVLSFLPPRDICTCKQLNRYSKDFYDRHEEEIWGLCLSRYFGIEKHKTLVHLGRRFGVGGDRVGRNLGMRFHEICCKYGSIGYRMIRAWSSIYESVEQYAKPVADTLLVPETAQGLRQFSDMFRSGFRRPMPMELECLYRVCGGQRHGDEPMDPPLESDSKRLRIRMDIPPLPDFDDSSEDAFQESGQIQFDPRPGMPDGIDGVARDRRIFAPDKPRPAWYVSSKDEMRRVELNYPHYEDIVSSMGYDIHPVPPLVHWMECYARELEMQHIQYHPVPGDGVCMLWRFPLKGPECRECVTGSIEVKSSCVLAPHAIQCPSNELVWAYSIQMRLLSVEEQRERGVDPSEILTVIQLRGRYWNISSANGVQEVQGGGVVGQYPVLREGGVAFEYQSYVSLRTTEHYANHDVPVEGRMEGHFTFANKLGRDQRPSAPVEAPIRAICPTMHLTFPDIVM